MEKLSEYLIAKRRKKNFEQDYKSYTDILGVSRIRLTSEYTAFKFNSTF